MEGFDFDGYVREAWLGVEQPEGWRTELLGRRIVLSPPLGNRHALGASRLSRALLGGIPDDWAILRQTAIDISPRLGVLMPDLVVAPRESLRDGWRDEYWFPAGLVLLVAEIADEDSAMTDRNAKLRAYAHAAVPLYLLIDRFADSGPTVELHSSPDGVDYRTRTRVPLGDPIELPEPFRMVLETKEF
ncbi:Uma2 family endonuclease [Saccharopolyspora shandongensis]|uniref:Uma2 family endonuclease n=1 Tax=Saccharopolyspora shandongensis TaxID=418495 RepID=UPI0033C83EDC